MRVGEIIDGRFEILRSTGSGGMGVVYRARDHVLYREVAIKVLLDRGAPPSGRFPQEIRLLSELGHPHIVGYVAHGTTGAGAPYLVMPWLEGQDLQERLGAGPLSVEDTLALARRVADALAYLHRRGIVHRDLKPSNLFLPGDRIEDVMLIDMGIASATAGERPSTASGLLLGTPGFMAPEQALDPRDVTPSVDVFALGCVLFECLTGRRLFEGCHLVAVLAKILAEEAPRIRALRADVPEALDRLVHRMVAKDAANRPRDGEELARCLQEPACAAIRTESFRGSRVALAAGTATLGLERLEPGERKVLRAASIFGEVFSIDGVEALLGDGPQTEAAVASLVRREEILPSDRPSATRGREFVFPHALARGAAYATLTEEERALGHALAARWLEQQGEDREAVGLHWLEAGDRRGAATCFAQAGEARLRRGHADAAARCAVRALLLGESDGGPADAIVARIRLLAGALLASHRVATDDVLTGIEHHAAAASKEARLDATRTIAHVALERSLALLRAAGGKNALASALARAARALAALSDFDGARKLLAEATAMADENARLRDVRYESARVASLAGEHGAVVDIVTTTLLPTDMRERLEILVLLAEAVVVVDGGEALARGLDFVVRAEALAAELGGDPLAQMQCARARLVCFGFSGEHAKAAEAAEAAVELSRRAGLRHEECLHLHNVGDACLRLGSLERARAALVASSALAVDLGADGVRLHNEVLLAYLDADPPRIEELADGFRAANDPWHEVHARYWLGRRLVADGAAHARRAVTRAVDLATRLKVSLVADELRHALGDLPIQTPS